ncbi:hypothetical protein L596_012912 [Steinernema carpocapsae]|uniref:Uncharacterized protein n=1 Tax=Steinernema carpocapsae TaxID=34508 RepID=A0A4U5NZ99_STECR|nr:hypothetical protein L596_012912 [Steinernema carpocapsae]
MSISDRWTASIGGGGEQDIPEKSPCPERPRPREDPLGHVAAHFNCSHLIERVVGRQRRLRCCWQLCEEAVRKKWKRRRGVWEVERYGGNRENYKKNA